MNSVSGVRWFAAGLAVVVFEMVVVSAAPAADPIKVGPEIDASSGRIATVPRVASDPAGNFMVVWEEPVTELVFGRRWHATGNEFLPEFQVSGPGHEISAGGSRAINMAGVAADAAGNFMMVYTAQDESLGAATCAGDPCLFARRNDANGVSGGLFTIQDSSTTYVHAWVGNDQVSNPEVASLSNGDFVVGWEGYDKSGVPGDYASDESTFARKTVASGQPKGSYFRVNDGTAYYQGQYGNFSASGDPSGGFVVVYEDEYYNYSYAPGGSLRAQIYNDKGKEVGPKFGVGPSEDSSGSGADIAHAADGRFMVVWVDYYLAGRIFEPDGVPVTDAFFIHDDPSYYPAVAASDDSFVVVWNNGPVMGKRFDLEGNALSSVFEISPMGRRYGPDVAAAANGDFIVAWKDAADYAKAQRFQVLTPVEQEIGVFGKVLVLTNKVPDDPEKNQLKWKATGPEIVSPPRGTSSDPRCNGDPVGTAKATVQFFSPTSGHDSGVIDLPCENWFALGGLKPGQVSKRSYRYRDSQLDEGPCKSVLVKGEKSITVKCQGKGETTDLPYDLEVETSEGTVHAVLDMGLYKFCSSFPPDGVADGSDGKKFKGKNAAIFGCPP